MLSLIVDDERQVRELVRTGLEERGVEVREAGSLAAATAAMNRDRFDVVILDLTLPDGSGLTLLEALRDTQPKPHVIVLSGALAELDRVRALELGADDYVVKPFFARELAARVLVVKRRNAHNETMVRIGALELDLSGRRLSAGGQVVDLTAKEFALLAYLALRPGHVFSRADLLHAVWQSAPDWQTQATVTEHIRRLRMKIELDPQHPTLLTTVRGVGYRFDLPIVETTLADPEPRVSNACGVGVAIAARIVFADAAVAALVGVEDEASLVGRHVLELVAPGSIDAALARVRRSAAGEPGRSQVLLILKPDATEVPLEITSTIVDWHGQTAARFELRPAADGSARIRHLVTGVLSEVTDAVVVTDMHLHISSWNGAAERLYGWAEGEVLGRHILDIIKWDGVDETTAAANAELRKADRWYGDCRQLARDGSVVTVRVSTMVARDDEGTPIGIVSVQRPIQAESATPVLEADSESVDDLRRGLEAGEFEAHYQPIVNLADHAVITIEALARWRHPERGLLSPAAFVDTAERSGLILDLGAQILSDACRQAAQWRRDGAAVNLAVNISAKELADPLLVDRITATAAESGLSLRALWLEVTETALVEEVEQAVTQLDRLAALGVGVSIDDFGTGWASLTYLRRFPVHVLKIDRTFVAGLDHDSNSAAIVRSILSLGAELNLAVVAEGVETVAQEQALRKLGCTIGQGFLYGRPVPADEVAVDRMHRMAMPGASSV